MIRRRGGFEKPGRLLTYPAGPAGFTLGRSSGGRAAFEGDGMILRCVLDGLLLPAVLRPGAARLVAYDGDEGFTLEAVEAVYYEVVAASPEELLGLERANYRLLRPARDFAWAEAPCPPSRDPLLD